MTPVNKSTLFSTASIMATLLLIAGCSQQAEEKQDGSSSSPIESSTAEQVVKIAEYTFDAERGRALFVSRNCVLCHSVNGVGGRAAFPLDKETFLSEIDAVNFAARMWRGAPEMIKLQQMELGYQINLSAQDIADLAAFAGNPEEQRKLSLNQVPEETQNAFLNEFIWSDEEYEGYVEE